MNHPEELLAAFVDGTATLQERATVEAHVTFCSTCREEIELARSARAALQALPDLEPPALRLGSPAAGRTAASASAGATAAPLAPLAAEPPGHPTEPIEIGPGRAQSPPRPHRPGRRRMPARWQVRAAQGALAVAAVAVAVALFANLGGNSKLTTPGAAPAATGANPAIRAAAPAPTRSAQALTAKTFGAFAADLAREAGHARHQDLLAGSPLTPEATPSPGAPFVEQALSCMQQGTGLVAGTRLYYVQGATYEGEPAYIGAFLLDEGTTREALVVVAVSIDGCRPLQVIHEAI